MDMEGAIVSIMGMDEEKTRMGEEDSVTSLVPLLWPDPQDKVASVADTAKIVDQDNKETDARRITRRGRNNAMDLAAQVVRMDQHPTSLVLGTNPLSSLIKLKLRRKTLSLLRKRDPIRLLMR
jgi:hypothetical protein